MTDIKLVSLHKHWITADSLDYHLRRSLKLPQENHMQGSVELFEMSKIMSSFAVLSVIYSLIYVVVEGYQELNLKDKNVDDLLSKTDFVAHLKRFRNATFHYQKNPLSEKMLQFISAYQSEVWVRQLNSALKRFFERELNLAEMLANLKPR